MLGGCGFAIVSLQVGAGAAVFGFPSFLGAVISSFCRTCVLDWCFFVGAGAGSVRWCSRLLSDAGCLCCGLSFVFAFCWVGSMWWICCRVVLQLGAADAVIGFSCFWQSWLLDFILVLVVVWLWRCNGFFVL